MLDHRHPAINMQCGTGDPPGLIRCQIGHRGGDVSRLAEPLSGGEMPPGLPTFAEALEVARMLDAARLATRERRRVPLDEVA